MIGQIMPPRQLPISVLKGSYPSGYSLEADSVAAKYSDPAAAIGEENVDYAALIYMNEQASLFWLPKFFAYLRDNACFDSYHFHVMLLRLSDPDFVAPLLSIAADDEIGSVQSYLTWLKVQPYQVESDYEQTAYDRAVRLWRR